MANEIIKRDQNHITVLAGVTDNSQQDVTMLRVDPSTKRLLVAATGGGGGGATIGQPVGGGTPGWILYIDESGNLFGDDQATRSSSTGETSVLKSYGGDIVGGLRLEPTEQNFVMNDTMSGALAGYFVTNNMGTLSADMGASDGAGSLSNVITAPGVATMIVTDGSDVSSLTMNPAQTIAKGKLFQIDSPVDRPIAKFDPQTNLIEMGDLGTNYSGSTLVFNTDTNTAEFDLNVMGGATTIVSTFNMNPTDGNILSWDANNGDNTLTAIYQNEDIQTSGLSGTAMTWKNTDISALIGTVDGTGAGLPQGTAIISSLDDDSGAFASAYTATQGNDGRFKAESGRGVIDSTLLIETTGNSMIFDSDNSDDVLFGIYQSDDLMSSGFKGTAITYVNTDGGSNLIIGDATGAGGQDYSVLLASNENAGDERSAAIFANFETGANFRYDDVSNFAAAVGLQNIGATLSFDDKTTSTKALIFSASTEAVVGFSNAAMVNTSLNVQDGYVRMLYDNDLFFQLDGAGQSTKIGDVTGGTTLISVNSSSNEIRLTTNAGTGQTIINNSMNEEFGRWNYTDENIAIGDIGVVPTASGYSMILDYNTGSFGLYNGIAGNPTLQTQASGYFFAGSVGSVYAAIDPLNNDMQFRLTNSTGSFQVRNGTLSLLSIDPLNQLSILGNSSMANVKTDGGTNVVSFIGGFNHATIRNVNYGTTTNLVLSDYDIQVGAGGSGATAVNLPTGTNAPIGTVFIIKDFGANGVANLITLDAGTGNTINGAAIAQTITWATVGVGGALTVKKITSSAWSIE